MRLLSAEVKYSPLRDLAEYCKIRISASLVDKTTYVGVDSLLPNKGGKTDSEHVPKEGDVIAYHAGDILIGNIRPYLKKIWLADIDGGTNGDVLVISIKKAEQIVPPTLLIIRSL